MDAGRWYILLPPLLLIGFLVGSFLLVAAAHSRLETATDRVHNSQIREQTLSEFVTLVAGTDSAQRGYLLTGERADLDRYRGESMRIDSAFDRVRAAYGAAATAVVPLARLRLLTTEKMAQLAGTVTLSRRADPSRSESILLLDADRHTMEAIMAIVGELRQQETAELSAATTGWRSDLRWSRWFTGLGALLNISLVLVAIQLVYSDMRRRTRQAGDLRDQKQELERQVDDRTAELTSLSTHLQGVSEQEKSALSRELHDELGGLLVAARMDLSWLQQRLPTSDPAIEQRFSRIHASLSAGVDLKRRVVEELRPTLLDNMGLFAALRWQFKESCRRSGLTCTETFPDGEPAFEPDAAIGIFRIAQEAMTNIVKHAHAKSSDLAVEIAAGRLSLRIADDGRGISTVGARSGSHGLASMRHRVSALGGSWDVISPANGGTIVAVSFPLARILALESVSAA